MALGSHHSKRRALSDRQLTLSDHINTERIQRKSETTQRIKAAAHTFLCMLFKLVVTLRLPENKYDAECWKKDRSRLFSVLSYMKIPC